MSVSRDMNISRDLSVSKNTCPYQGPWHFHRPKHFHRHKAFSKIQQPLLWLRLFSDSMPPPRSPFLTRLKFLRSLSNTGPVIKHYRVLDKFIFLSHFNFFRLFFIHLLIQYLQGLDYRLSDYHDLYPSRPDWENRGSTLNNWF